MKIIMRGSYSAIDNLLDELRLRNVSALVSARYPEAYYHSKKFGKGTVVAFTDSAFLDFSAVNGRRFLGLYVCIVCPGYVWVKEQGSCATDCTSVRSSYCGVETLCSPGDDRELGSYETLDLWERRTGGYQDE